MAFSTGKDPVSANIFLVNADQDFDLSRSRQVEIGLKADLGDAGSLTLAVCDIKRRDILMQVVTDIVSNIGSQRSRGIKLFGQARLTAAWAITASGTYVDAEYGEFVDPSYGVAASGNRPPNVPMWTTKLWTSVQHIAGLPLEAGGGHQVRGQALRQYSQRPHSESGSSTTGSIRSGPSPGWAQAIARERRSTFPLARANCSSARPGPSELGTGAARCCTGCT
jgi:outer membrane receptor protein involved in Fe transport